MLVWLLLLRAKPFFPLQVRISLEDGSRWEEIYNALPDVERSTHAPTGEVGQLPDPILSEQTSCLTLPISAAGTKPVAVLQVRLRDGMLTREEREALSMLVRCAGMAIERCLQHQQVQDLAERTMQVRFATSCDSNPHALS